MVKTTAKQYLHSQNLHYLTVGELILANMNLLALIVAVAVMPLFSFALTLPASVQAGDNKQELKIIYHKAADSNITVEVLSTDGLVGWSFSSSLDSGAFEKLPIIFDVDERGSGNLTVGPSTYLIHEDANYSGGIVCGRMFNQAEAAVSCTVAVPADLPLQPVGKIDTAEGIPDGPRGLARVLRVAANPPSGPMDTLHSMWGRDPPADIPPNSCEDDDPSGKTEVIGDGDPHQNYYDIQLSVSECFLAQPIVEVTLSKPAHASTSNPPPKHRNIGSNPPWILADIRGHPGEHALWTSSIM